jgi:hypothetical protein
LAPLAAVVLRLSQQKITETIKKPLAWLDFFLKERRKKMLG